MYARHSYQWQHSDLVHKHFEIFSLISNLKQLLKNIRNWLKIKWRELICNFTIQHRSLDITGHKHITAIQKINKILQNKK